MKNPRTYGQAPYGVAVVHGGPGASGEMAPVARKLAAGRGILEPVQTAATLECQIEELRSIVEEHGDLPVTLIGFSWGAWLSFLLAARHGACVKKLILVASGPFEENYTERLLVTRLSRLDAGEREEVDCLIQFIHNPAAEEKNRAMERLGELITKADAFDPMAREPEAVDYRADIFMSVWREAAELRRSGRLLELAGKIQCPVVAIHGDYDPHPAEGVREPLTGVLENFRFVLLQKCGHRPWIERHAADEFYRILEQELR
ncbi:MAG: alpha/beta hydrolase [Pseudomonadota bacterium]